MNMSKLFGRANLNGVGNSKGNFPRTPTQIKPDFGNDQTQNNPPFPLETGRYKINRKRKLY